MPIHHGTVVLRGSDEQKWLATILEQVGILRMQHDRCGKGRKRGEQQPKEACDCQCVRMETASGAISLPGFSGSR